MSDAAAAAAPEEGAPKKKGKLVIILIAVVALLAGGGGAAFFFLSHGDAAHEEEAGDEGDHGDKADAKEKSKKKKKKKVEYEGPPVYHRLDPATVNLAGGGSNFLAANVELKLAEPHVSEELKARAPEIRNLVLMTLSAQKPEDIANAEGKAKLAQTLRDKINEIVELDEESGVVDVFFTEFIMQ